MIVNGLKDKLGDYVTKSIDRIKNLEGYSPDNCRWVNNIEQANNKSNNKIICYEGQKYTLTQICKKYGLSRHALSTAIYKKRNYKEWLDKKISKRQAIDQ
jgi:hypothetical protein